MEAARTASMSAEHSALWLSLIESRIGMVLPQLQHRLFESRVFDRMQACGLDMNSYYQLVRHDRAEWQRLAESLVVHETAFFRHPPSYDLVAKHLSRLNRDVRIWSVGCATGEEAWSLAMTARQHALRTYRVMATDISEHALRVARQGIYPARRADSIPDAMKLRFGQALASGQWQVSNTLMSQVSFHLLNLMDVAQAPFRRLDVIFCQNVLIYFRKFDRRDILDALAHRLELGGVLVLGPGEMADWQHPQMRRVDHAGTLAYERIKA
jgi:chemotaxis methyl-accepting protein methylase